MRKNYPSELKVHLVKKEISDIVLSPSKSTVDKILAFSAAYWTMPLIGGMSVELMMN